MKWASVLCMQEAGHTASQQLSQSQTEQLLHFTPSSHCLHFISGMFCSYSSLYIQMPDRSWVDRKKHEPSIWQKMVMWHMHETSPIYGVGKYDEHREDEDCRKKKKKKKRDKPKRAGTERGRQGRIVRNYLKCSETERELKHSRVWHRQRGERKTEALT